MALMVQLVHASLSDDTPASVTPVHPSSLICRSAKHKVSTALYFQLKTHRRHIGAFEFEFLV
jgi:hypothetical protein